MRGNIVRLLASEFKRCGFNVDVCGHIIVVYRKSFFNIFWSLFTLAPGYIGEVIVGEDRCVLYNANKLGRTLLVDFVDFDIDMVMRFFR